jgi:hypothetical protein
VVVLAAVVLHLLLAEPELAEKAITAEAAQTQANLTEPLAAAAALQPLVGTEFREHHAVQVVLVRLRRLLALP